MDVEGGQTQDQVLFTNRQMDLSVSLGIPIAQPEMTATQVEPTTASATLEATVSLTEEPTVQPTLTEATATDVATPLPQNPGVGNSSWPDSLTGPLAASVIVLVMAIISFRALRRRRR
jgi:hypothetical protein